MDVVPAVVKMLSEVRRPVYYGEEWNEKFYRSKGDPWGVRSNFPLQVRHEMLWDTVRNLGGTECAVDVACGEGLLILNHLARKYHRLHGIDRSATAITRAKQAASNRAGITFDTADVLSYTLPGELTGSVNLVTVMSAIQYFSVEEKGQLLRLFAEWLAPGGHVVLETHCKVSDIFSLSQGRDKYEPGYDSLTVDDFRGTIVPVLDRYELVKTLPNQICQHPIPLHGNPIVAAFIAGVVGLFIKLPTRTLGGISGKIPSDIYRMRISLCRRLYGIVPLGRYISHYLFVLRKRP